MKNLLEYMSLSQRNNNKENYAVDFNCNRSREGEVELWMQDVVVQERLGGRVFNLARSYLYRFLSSTTVRNSQLQLLAAACLLLSSKVLSKKPVGCKQLLEYTANDILAQELIDMEMVVLSSLCWDLYSDTVEVPLVQFTDSLNLSSSHL